MASQESYYAINASHPPPTSPLPPHMGAGGGAPPPPPPKPSSHDPSRTSTPLTPMYHHQSPHPQSPIPPPHPNYGSPPPIPPQHPQSPHNVNSPVHSMPAQGRMPGQATTQQQPQSHTYLANPPPPLNSGWLPEKLSSHTTTDLSSLLSQPTLVSSLALQHPSYASSLAPVDSAISANLASAKQVSQLEAQVKALREQTGQLLLQHTSLQTQWRKKQGEMDDALAPWGPRNMYQRLVASISEQEALLFAVFESFMDSGSDGGGGKVQHDYYSDTNGGKASEKEVTEWIKRIKEGATILEKRREMRARWDETRVGGWR